MAFTLINEPVSVHLIIGEKGCNVLPVRVKWRGKTYVVLEVGKRHTDRRGIKKIHLFTIDVGTLNMRLEIDGDSLAAKLIATSDGLPD